MDTCSAEKLEEKKRAMRFSLFVFLPFLREIYAQNKTAKQSKHFTSP